MGAREGGGERSWKEGTVRPFWQDRKHVSVCEAPDLKHLEP